MLRRLVEWLAPVVGLAVVDRSDWHKVREELRKTDRHARSVGYRRRRRSSRRIQRSMARALEALDRL